MPTSTFRDAISREWQIRITGPLVVQVRTETGVDPLAPEDWIKIRTDEGSLVGILLVLLRDEAVKRTITDLPEQLYGDALDHAEAALLTAVKGFSRPLKRGLFDETLADFARQWPLLMDIGRLKAQTAEKVAKSELEKLTLSTTTGPAPESSASTPAA